MGVVDEIESAREDGIVHCGLSSQASPSVAELAAEFGLSRDPGVYREIDAAYNSEIIPLPRAAELADRFLDQFGTDGVRYYTNGTFHEARGPSLTWSGASWNPATEATFDTGVLVVGPNGSGCLWVEDED
jgi:hypothetical protein